MVALPPYGKLDLAVVTPDGSGITSLKSLAGKKIGVTAVGAFTEKFAAVRPAGRRRQPEPASPSSPSGRCRPSWRR